MLVQTEQCHWSSSIDFDSWDQLFYLAQLISNRSLMRTGLNAGELDEFEINLLPNLVTLVEFSLLEFKVCDLECGFRSVGSKV